MPAIASRYFRAAVRWRGFAALAAGLAAGLAIGSHLGAAQGPAPAIVPLLSTGQTVLGAAIAYPAGMPAKVTAAILTLPPGGETGWHSHAAPTFGYVLEGEMTVDYGLSGERAFRAGDGLLEAVGVPHNGRNSGAAPARILSVFMGEEGLAPSLPADAPK
jgi:quercetin dioxygenase-like cupin family protein